MQALMRALPRLTQLADLELQCRTVDLAVLAPPLCSLTTLTRLDVSDCRVSEGGTGTFASALTRLTRLADLKLCAVPGRVLARALDTLTALTSLDLDRLDDDDDGVQALARTFERLSLLVVLRMTLDGCGAASAAALTVALDTRTALTALQLSNVCHNAVFVLAPALSRLSRLAGLRMAHSELGPEGTALLAAPVALLTTLTLLDLTDNGVRDEGLCAEALAPALSRLSRLADLSLGYNRLRAAGVVALAPALSTLTALTRLVFVGDAVGTDGVDALAECLRHLTLLADLRLTYMRLGDGDAALLAPALHHLTALQQLHLSHNGLRDAGAEHLAPALSRLPRLAELHLHNNNIGDAGCGRLLSELPPRSPLHTFDVASNRISKSLAAKEAVALSRLFALTCLRL